MEHSDLKKKMTSQFNPKNFLPECVVPYESPKTHFEIMRKTFILDKPKIKLDMSSSGGSGTPQFEDDISQESKNDDVDCERNILLPIADEGSDEFLGEQVGEKTDVEDSPEEESPDEVKLDQHKVKVQACLQDLEILTSKLLGTALKNISTNSDGWKYRESMLKKLIPPTDPTITTLNAVSLPSKIKQELLKIKADVENKLAGSKQTDKRLPCADEIDNQSGVEKTFPVDMPTPQDQPSEMDQQLEWLQSEIRQAEQALSEFQADRQELVARKGCLDKKLPRLPPDVEKMKNDLVLLKMENLNLQEKLESVLNEKQILEVEFQKTADENRAFIVKMEEYKRIRREEKMRLHNLVEYLEKTQTQWNALMQCLEDNQASQQPSQ